MKKYSCKNCGAELYWNAKEEMLACEYCGKKYTVAEFEGEGSADAAAETKVDDGKNEKAEQVADENVKADDGSTAYGDLVKYHCTNCGADVITSNITVATKCPYCDRAITMDSKIQSGLKIDTIIPFSITKEQAFDYFKKYLKKTPMTPKAFKDNHVVEEMKGMYVPFYLHNAAVEVNAEYKGERVGSRHRSGDYIIEKRLMYNIPVNTQAKFENIPTDASEHMRDDLMDAIEPFDYDKICDFNSAYMAGFYAEEATTSKEDTWSRFRERVEKELESETVGATKGYLDVTRLNYNVDYKTHDVTQTMAPVWYFKIDHKGKKYECAVNGQTGECVGKIPFDYLKATLASALSGGAILIIYFIIKLILTLNGSSML